MRGTLLRQKDARLKAENESPIRDRLIQSRPAGQNVVGWKIPENQNNLGGTAYIHLQAIGQALGTMAAP